MNKKDEAVISNFIDKVRKIPEVEGIVLYGSLARGDYDRRSDIDLLVILNTKRPVSFLTQITKICSDIEKDRKITPVLTNLRDKDEGFLRNVFREGSVLYGKLLLTAKQMALRPYMLVTYDLSNKKHSLQVKISRKVYGYASKKKLPGGKIYEYKYRGLKGLYNATVVSDSTMILPYDKAQEFMRELNKLKVKYKHFDIFMW
ncbi:MAG: nucleotidyltransferase domain-containing protein [Candidatus Thermoplasmatota archaeon]|nr:nucleotidyltransferase domain-containing protein [Candidatus Thermoplasmatota archaeon]